MGIHLLHFIYIYCLCIFNGLLQWFRNYKRGRWVEEGEEEEEEEEEEEKTEGDNEEEEKTEEDHEEGDYEEERSEEEEEGWVEDEEG